MPDVTHRFALPFILPGQAQKEIYHNEALNLIDVALSSAVESVVLKGPPAAPTEGQCWLVAPSATGDWAGRSGQIAAWTSGGWRFVAPVPGMAIWSKADGHWHHFDGADWQAGHPAKELVIDGKKVVGRREPAVSSPSGGTIIDEEARQAIDALIATLKSHGLIE